jgi:hypothetical protein
MREPRLLRPTALPRMASQLAGGGAPSPPPGLRHTESDSPPSLTPLCAGAAAAPPPPAVPAAPAAAAAAAAAHAPLHTSYAAAAARVALRPSTPTACPTHVDQGVASSARATAPASGAPAAAAAAAPLTARAASSAGATQPPADVLAVLARDGPALPPGLPQLQLLHTHPDGREWPAALTVAAQSWSRRSKHWLLHLRLAIIIAGHMISTETASRISAIAAGPLVDGQQVLPLPQVTEQLSIAHCDGDRVPWHGSQQGYDGVAKLDRAVRALLRGTAAAAAPTPAAAESTASACRAHGRFASACGRRATARQRKRSALHSHLFFSDVINGYEDYDMAMGTAMSLSEQQQAHQQRELEAARIHSPPALRVPRTRNPFDALLSDDDDDDDERTCLGDGSRLVLAQGALFRVQEGSGIVEELDSEPDSRERPLAAEELSCTVIPPTPASDAHAPAAPAAEELDFTVIPPTPSSPASDELLRGLTPLRSAGTPATAAPGVAATTAAAVAAAPASATSGHPPAVSIELIDGSRQQCLYGSFNAATGTSLPKIRRRMAKIVRGSSIEQCISLGLFERGPDMRLSKKLYLESAYHRLLRNGRDAEINLLGIAFDGHYRIVTIHPDPLSGTTHQFAPHPDIVGQMQGYEHIPAKAKREIVLCHGSYQGNGSRSHYDLLRFGPERTALLDIDPQETRAQQMLRYESYLPSCREHDAQAKSRQVEALARDALVAAQDPLGDPVQQQLIMDDIAARVAKQKERDRARSATAVATAAVNVPASAAAPAAASSSAGAATAPTSLRLQPKGKPAIQSPPGARTGLSWGDRVINASMISPGRARTFHSSRGRAATSASRGQASNASPRLPSPSASTPSVALWKQRRTYTMKVLHRSNSALFRDHAGALFQAYTIHSERSERGDADRHRTADEIMGFPFKTLIQGSRANNQSKRVRLFTDANAHQLLDEARQAAAADSHAHAEASAAAAAATAPPGPVPMELCSDDECSSSAGSAVSDAKDPATASDPDSRTVGNALRIFNEGGPHAMSRSAKSLRRTSMAESNAESVAQLKQLHPSAASPLPPLPATCPSGIIALDHLGDIIQRRVDNGSETGPSGWSGSHLMTLWSGKSAETRKGLELFIRDICNGNFNDAMRERLLACRLVALRKPDGGIRPIAIGEVFTKCAAHCMMALAADDMRAFFPSIQYGVNRAGGSETAAQLIRAALHERAKKHPNTIALKTDFKNAFNSISRRLVWEKLQAHPRASVLLRAFHFQYGRASPLLFYHRRDLFAELSSSEGVRQGCPFAAFAFSLVVQSLYEDALKQCADCSAVAIQDDLTLVGPADQVLKAFAFIQAHAKDDYSLELRVDKCQVFTPPAIACLPDGPSLISSILSTCSAAGISCSNRMECLGVMFGCDDTVRAHCSSEVQSSEYFFSALQHRAMPAQVAQCLLRYCGVPKLNYLARTVEPELLDAASRQFDALAMETQLQLARLHDSLAALPQSSATAVAAGPEQHDSFATAAQIRSRISLPISMSGLGVRSIHSLRHAAFYASLLQALPEFLSLFPTLSESERPLTQLYQQMHTCRNSLLQCTLSLEDAASLHLSPHFKSSSPPDALTQSIDAIWSSLAEAKAKGNKTATHVPSALKLQHAITESIETRQYVTLFNSCQRYQQTIMTALACTPAPSGFLTAVPTDAHPEYRMDNERWRLAIRHRLGLCPYPALTEEDCALDCLKTRNHVPSFHADPDHFHSCITNTGASVTRRHNRIADAVTALARMGGFHITQQPNFPPHPDSQLPADSTSSHSLRRGDLLLTRGNQQLLIDVSVTRPTGVSALNTYPAVTHEPLLSTIAVEQRKHRTYDAECKLHRWQLYPFVLESYGGLGRDGRKLLAMLCSAACRQADIAPAEFMTHANSLISVALQSGNADIAVQGMTAYNNTRQRCGFLPGINFGPRPPGSPHVAESCADTSGRDIGAQPPDAVPTHLAAAHSQAAQPVSPSATAAAPPSPACTSPPSFIRVLSTPPPSRKRKHSHWRPGPLEKARRASGSHKHRAADDVLRSTSPPLPAPATESDEAHAVHITVDEDELAGDTARPREGLRTCRDVFVSPLAEERLD